MGSSRLHTHVRKKTATLRPKPETQSKKLLLTPWGPSIILISRTWVDQLFVSLPLITAKNREHASI